jgi:hypothetical protein
MSPTRNDDPTFTCPRWCASIRELLRTRHWDGNCERRDETDWPSSGEDGCIGDHDWQCDWHAKRLFAYDLPFPTRQSILHKSGAIVHDFLKRNILPFDRQSHWVLHCRKLSRDCLTNWFVGILHLKWIQDSETVDSCSILTFWIDHRGIDWDCQSAEPQFFRKMVTDGSLTT